MNEAAPSGRADGESVSYSADRPIGARTEDRFQRWGFAKRIADTIAHRHDPRGVVLGVFGAWGEGKTSVLNLITEALKEHDNVIPIRFNPWYFASEPAVLKALFSTLAQGIGKKLPTIEVQLGQALEKWGHVLSLGSGSLAGGVVTLSPGEPLAKLGASLADTSLESLRDRIQALLSGSKRRVVVLIDDIDRLDRSEIQALFKAVRLSGDFDYVTYVLALDENIVSASLAERYPTGHERAGRDFLEKIIQVPLHLPPADSRALRALAFEGVEEALKVAGLELTASEIQPFVIQFGRAFEPALSTPRQARRYSNALLFSLPLLKGEVHVPDQLLIEGLHVFYPILYEIIRSHPDEFLGGPSRTIDDKVRTIQRELLAKGIEGHPETTRSALERLLGEIFPRFKSVGYGAEWEKSWAREKRVCSRYYFSRYFSYAVPAGDVSDVIFDHFLAALESEPSSSEALWQTLASQDNTPRLVEKLRGRASEFSPAAAAALSISVARLASILPRESGAFSYLSTSAQAAILLRDLIESLPSGDRLSHAEKLLAEAGTIVFASECFRWLRTPDDSREERVLEVGEEEILGRQLAARIKQHAEDAWILSEFGKDTPFLLWLWKTFGEDGAVQVSNYLERSFSRDPARIPPFLGVFTGRAWGLESGLPVRARFARDAYDTVVSYSPAELIRGHLERLYGERLDASSEFVSDDVPEDLALANQFAFVDDHVRSGNETPQDPT